MKIKELFQNVVDIILNLLWNVYIILFGWEYKNKIKEVLYGEKLEQFSSRMFLIGSSFAVYILCIFILMYVIKIIGVILNV